MGNIILARAILKPTRLYKRIIAHKDVSEGSVDQLIARRIILNYEVLFYRDGRRKIRNLELEDQDIHDSEILRFTHASILLSEPCGDKKYCYVDASVNPVEVWIFGKRIHKASDLLNQFEGDFDEKAHKIATL